MINKKLSLPSFIRNNIFYKSRVYMREGNPCLSCPFSGKWKWTAYTPETAARYLEHDDHVCNKTQYSSHKFLCVGWVFAMNLLGRISPVPEVAEYQAKHTCSKVGITLKQEKVVPK